MVRTELRADEAVLLAHALVCRLAEQVGTRVLFIKGRTAVALGARPDRPSQDVDVLVDPEGFDRLCDAIMAAGWVKRGGQPMFEHVKDLTLEHSAHFIHDEWPCDLDVHFNFPGFLHPADDVFDALWQHHTTVDIAACPVTTPDLLGQLVVVALHGLRNPDLPFSRQDLAHVRATLHHLGEARLRTLVTLAGETGAIEPMRALLEEQGVPLTPVTQTPGLADWQRRVKGENSGTSIWLAELRRAPWQEKLRTLRNAALPSRDYLLGAYHGHRATRRELVVLHAKRWARGIRSLPSAAKWVRRRPK